MTEHTPGPWEIAQADDFQPFAILAGAKPHRAIVCRYSEWCDARGEAEANARLIAGAPDLLAALEEIEAHHVEINRKAGRDESRSSTLRIARAAIKKATGQS